MSPGKGRSPGMIVTTLPEKGREVDTPMLRGIYFAAAMESMWTLFFSLSRVADTVT
jgi:hypothetical protein